MEKETELFEGEIPYSDGISESLSNFFSILSLNLNFETDIRLPQMVLPYKCKTLCCFSSHYFSLSPHQSYADSLKAY